MVHNTCHACGLKVYANFSFQAREILVLEALVFAISAAGQLSKWRGRYLMVRAGRDCKAVSKGMWTSAVLSRLGSK